MSTLPPPPDRVTIDVTAVGFEKARDLKIPTEYRDSVESKWDYSQITNNRRDRQGCSQGQDDGKSKVAFIDKSGLFLGRELTKLGLDKRCEYVSRLLFCDERLQKFFLREASKLYFWRVVQTAGPFASPHSSYMATSEDKKISSWHEHYKIVACPPLLHHVGGRDDYEYHYDCHRDYREGRSKKVTEVVDIDIGILPTVELQEHKLPIVFSLEVNIVSGEHVEMAISRGLLNHETFQKIFKDKLKNYWVVVGPRYRGRLTATLCRGVPTIDCF